MKIFNKKKKSEDLNTKDVKKFSPEERTKKIKQLKENEACEITYYVHVRRVPGGLIYYTEDRNHHAITSQFVPVKECYFDTKH